MTDYTELKRLAEAATPTPWERGDGNEVMVSEEGDEAYWSWEQAGPAQIHGSGEQPVRDADFIAAANPAAVLALIADLDEARNGMKHSCAIRLKKRIELLETQRDQLIADNERPTKAVGLQVIRRFVGDDDQKNIDELVAAGIQVDKELIVQLKAENERLAAACERAEQIIIVECKAASLAKVRANLLEANRDQLRAEVAGLKTGYEAYERVNAELKAENEALRANSSLVVLLPELDSVLEDLEIHGQHSDQGYRKLKDWYRKVDLACKAIDAALGQGEQS